MMSEEVMADVQRTLGRIEQKVDTALAWQQAHVLEDKAAFGTLREDIKALQLTGAQTAGRKSVVTGMLTLVAGGVGSAVTWFLQRHTN